MEEERDAITRQEEIMKIEKINSTNGILFPDRIIPRVNIKKRIGIKYLEYLLNFS